MKKIDKLKYSISPLLEMKLEKIDHMRANSDTRKKAYSELIDIFTNMPIKKVCSIMKKRGFDNYLDFNLFPNYLFKNPDFVDFIIDSNPSYITKIDSNMIKQYHVQRLINWHEKNLNNGHGFIDICQNGLLVFDEYVDYIIKHIKDQSDYFKDSDREFYLNSIYKVNRKRFADYVSALEKDECLTTALVNKLDKEIQDYLFTLPSAIRLKYSDLAYFDYYKTEEIEQLDDDLLSTLCHNLITLLGVPNQQKQIESRKVFFWALKWNYSALISDRIVTYPHLSLEEIYNYYNTNYVSMDINLLDYIDYSQINENNLDLFIKCLQMNANIKKINDERLLNLMLAKNIDGKAIYCCFDKEMIPKDVINKMYESYSLGELRTFLKIQGIDVYDLDVRYDVLLEKLNNSNVLSNEPIDNQSNKRSYRELVYDLTGNYYTFEDVIELLFIISKLRKYKNDEQIENKISFAINKVKSFLGGYYTAGIESIEELIDLIINGERSPFVLYMLIGKYNQYHQYHPKLIKYIIRFGNVFDDDVKEFIYTIPIEVIEKANKKHIIEIMNLLRSLEGYNEIFTEKHVIRLAFNIYMTLGYERSVSFLSTDPKKNYGPVNFSILQEMFNDVSLSDILMIKSGNGFLPMVNEKLINMVFGNSNKVANTPIRNVLNDNQDRLNVLLSEIEAIRRNPNLSEEQKEAEITKAEEKCNKYLKEVNDFVRKYAVCVNKWDIIEEEFLKKQNRTKNKLKLTPGIVNSILSNMSNNTIILDDELDRPLKDSKVFDYVEDYNRARAIDLSRRMSNVSCKKFPRLQLSDGNYQIRIYDAQDRNILCAGYQSSCCFRPNGCADDNGKDYSLLTYCCTTEYGGGVEIVDSNDKMLMFSPIIRNGNVLMIHSVETSGGFDEKCARLLEKFARKIIEESEKVGDNIDFVTLTNLHHVELVHFLGVLPDSKRFRIFDKNNSFTGMYNNLAGREHLILASKKGKTTNDIEYGPVNYSYIHDANTNTFTKSVMFNPDIVKIVIELLLLKSEIIDLTNERTNTKDERLSYQLLLQINERKRVYLDKYSILLKENFGIDYLQELNNIVTNINIMDDDINFTLQNLMGYRHAIYNPFCCILIDEEGVPSYIVKKDASPDIMNLISETARLYGLSDEEIHSLN